MNPLPVSSLAVVMMRGDRLPAGASEAVAEAGGSVLLLGGSSPVPGASSVWWTPSLPPATLLAPLLSEASMVVLPASPDGRDMAPVLSATLGWPLLGGAVSCSLSSGKVCASLLRVDGRVTVPASVPAPAVVTLWPGSRPSLPVASSRSAGSSLPVTSSRSAGSSPPVASSRSAGSSRSTAQSRSAGSQLFVEVELPPAPVPAVSAPPAVSLVELVEPDPATMDLSEARRVLGGGAGLVPNDSSVEQARAWFSLLVDVAAALGASAGATRVVTDAGWADHNRQIGTTGVAVNPELYVALGVSGASQHVGGLGSPDHTISVNVDPSCPMTAMSELGLVADAPGVLVELARRLGVDIPPVLEVAR